MNDLDKAVKLLKESGYTSIIMKKDVVYSSVKKGITPLTDIIASEADVSGFSAADTIIGKAAALLFALLNIKSVYGEVMSKTAVEVFRRNGIEYSYGILADTIVNRAGNGICPMEQAVENIDEPLLAYKAVIEKLKELKAKKH